MSESSERTGADPQPGRGVREARGRPARPDHRHRDGGVGGQPRPVRRHRHGESRTRAPSNSSSTRWEADQIAVHISLRIDQRIPHACLRGEVNHNIGASRFEQARGRGGGEIDPVKREPVAAGEQRQPVFLEAHLVVVTEVVDADDGVAAVQQPPGEMKSDETSRAGNDHSHRLNHTLRPSRASYTAATSLKTRSGWKSASTRSRPARPWSARRIGSV